MVLAMDLWGSSEEIFPEDITASIVGNITELEEAEASPDSHSTIHHYMFVICGSIILLSTIVAASIHVYICARQINLKIIPYFLIFNVSISILVLCVTRVLGILTFAIEPHVWSLTSCRLHCAFLIDGVSLKHWLMLALILDRYILVGTGGTGWIQKWRNLTNAKFLVAILWGLEVPKMFYRGYFAEIVHFGNQTYCYSDTPEFGLNFLVWTWIFSIVPICAAVIYLLTLRAVWKKREVLTSCLVQGSGWDTEDPVDVTKMVLIVFSAFLLLQLPWWFIIVSGLDHFVIDLVFMPLRFLSDTHIFVMIIACFLYSRDFQLALKTLCCGGKSKSVTFSRNTESTVENAEEEEVELHM